MLIIDEISMIDLITLSKVDNKLRDLRECRTDPYGGMHVIFVGDFRKLEPIGKASSAIFHNLNSPSWIHAVNTYVEMMGMY